MESIEFLGGRYNRPEQIMSGPVQAFRAQSAATGKTVFIHRVSTTESPEEQAALLKLLTLALVKSAEAKRLVLDFGEERTDWFVVTESEPQCALLREWLQLEIDALSGSSRSPVSMRPQTPIPTEPVVAADPGEFTRFLQSRPTSSTKPGSVAPQQAKPPQPQASAGEFTRAFSDTAFHDTAGREESVPISPSLQKPPSPQKPVPPPFVPPALPPQAPPQPTTQGPGEFTRFFTPGLPVAPPKPPQPAVPDRTLNNPHVQRPTPAMRPAPDVQETGEFTRMFSRPQDAQTPVASQANAFQPQPVKRSDPLGFSRPEVDRSAAAADDLFSDTIDVGKPLPPTQKTQGEFTKIFGSSGAEAPPMMGPSVVAASNERPLLDERGPSPKLPPIQPHSISNPPGENASSPFTMMMQGIAPAGSTANPAAAPKQGGAGLPPLNFQAPPIALPPKPVFNSSVSPAGASASSPFGSVHVNAPPMPQANVPLPGFAVPPVKGNANKKLIIFFALLAILTIALIVVILFVMKNK